MTFELKRELDPNRRKRGSEGRKEGKPQGNLFMIKF
jgi:hypothetical protein